MPFEGKLALMSLLWLVVFGIGSALCYENGVKAWKSLRWVAVISFLSLLCALSIAIWRA